MKKSFEQANLGVISAVDRPSHRLGAMLRRLSPVSTSIVRHSLTGLVLLWFALPATLSGQEMPDARQTEARSVTVVPGSRYQAGWLRKFLAGRGYRNLWTTSLPVEVAALATLGGGVRSLWLGDDALTKALHVRGADGKHYVLRSVDKFVGLGLPELERGTLIETVLQDQISAYHPSAAIVVSTLLGAVGVLHAEPRLMVLADDPQLGQFRDEFAGLLVLFEERPDKGPDDMVDSEGLSKSVGTERLFELLDRDPRHLVDAHAFLKARLFDLFIGDRDRNVNNWWWKRCDDGEHYIWQPIPRNHDQAFIRLDGFVKGKLRFYNPRLVAFGEDYSSIVGLTRSSWNMDRRFLVGLDKPAWDSVVTELQTQLTDSVIDSAVQQLPPEHYRLVGADLVRTLKRRRDRLREAADRFYQIVSGYADIHASDQSDLAVIEKIDDDHVEVRVHSQGEVDGEFRKEPYFYRIFDGRETREIRLYLLSGVDRVLVRGVAQGSITVRIVGGEGIDKLVGSPQVREGQIYFYDTGDRPVTRDWGSRWRPALVAGFNADHGAIIGGGVIWHGYGFRKIPYRQRLLLRGGVSTSKRFLFEYQSDFAQIATGLSGTLHVFWSGVDRARFYGFGNKTDRLSADDFHHVTQYRFLVDPSLSFSPLSQMQFSFGPVLKLTSTHADSAHIVRDTLYGAGLFGQVGARTALQVDLRDQHEWTTRGLRLDIGAEVYPAVLDVTEVFGQLHGTVATYLSASIPTEPTLAIRLGGKKVWGRVPFHEAAYIGGERSLRGYELQRFAGDAAVYGSAELRLTLVRFFFLFPSEFGVFGLADAGRVYVEGLSPGGWHTDGGGGVWLAPLRRAYTVSFAVARGAEQTAFYLRTGFHF